MTSSEVGRSLAPVHKFALLEAYRHDRMDITPVTVLVEAIPGEPAPLLRFSSAQGELTRVERTVLSEQVQAAQRHGVLHAEVRLGRGADGAEIFIRLADLSRVLYLVHSEHRPPSN